MKKNFTLFLVLITTTTLWAYDFKVGDLCYNITSNTKPYSVEVTDAASSITTATIPETVTYNGTIYSVTSIGSSAFYKCSSLTSVTIPNSVTSIGDEAFGFCKSLASITIPNSVTSIGGSAFRGCSALTSVTIPNSVTSIGNSAFQGCSSLTSVTIPNSVTSIGDWAFTDCSGLTSVIIPNSVTSIGGWAFHGCSSLTSVTIGGSVTSIGRNAFYDCSSLTSITIPNSVTSIGLDAFYDCSGLTSITCEAETPPTVGSYAFYKVSKSIPVYVPCGCVEAYKADSGWKEFINIQEPLMTYSLIVDAQNSQMGSAKVDYNTPCDGNQISAEANYGYHFVQWSDGNTDNPRSLVLTQDTILTAEFAPNQYTIITTSSHPERGTTQGDATVNYLENVTISATANYGYHFTHWNDKNKENPRLILAGGKEIVIAAGTDQGNAGIDDSNNATEYIVSKSGVTMTVSKGIIGSYNTHYRVYKSQTLTLTSTVGEITSVEFTCTTNDDEKYGPGCFTWSTGDYSYSGAVGTWTGSANEVVFTASLNQVRVTQIVVKIGNYHENQTYTAYFDKNTYYITKNYNSNQGYINGSSSGEYLDNIALTAEPNYGYHFTQWSDGNTDNPRSLVLTQDTILTAEFAINTYTLTTKSNGNGNVTGNGTYKHGENVIISATADIGYHFVQWNDGNTDNPRTLVLTQDTILTAEFAVNKYLISTVSNDPKRGTTSGDTLAAYLDYVTISATAKYGYHFSSWENGNADNPRLVQATGDKEYMAYFDKNSYTVTTSCNGSYGTVSPSVTGEYLDTITLTAAPTLGYHFSRWSDGNTQNPRKYVVTKDITLTAEFAQSFAGQCGDNLYWAYNESDQSIAITGTGDMYNYTSGTQPWVLFLEKIKKVTTDNTAASLGTSAFEEAIRLAEVHIGAKIDMIEANVFAGCERLRNIYCYPTYPPIIRESSFARYDALLYIPCDYLDEYEFDNNWKKFENIQCAGAEKEEIESDDVDVDPSSTSVTMTWPTEENANTYTIEIMKGGALFCRLVFNTTGQLLNISFAPSRDGNNRPVQYAEQVANGSGLRFTVTGLNERTHYTYDLRAKDKDENTIQSHSGEFTTKSNVSTSVSDIQSPITNCQKLLRNGQLVIVRDGVEYNAMGTLLD